VLFSIVVHYKPHSEQFYMLCIITRIPTKDQVLLATQKPPPESRQ